LKLGIIGLPGCGKSTVFKALTGGIESSGRKGHAEPGVGVVKVKDERLDYLADYHKPKKVTPTQVEYLDIAGVGEGKPGQSIGDKTLAHIRPLDALVHCVRFFDSPLRGPAQAAKDFSSFQEEMILSDLSIVEKRLEKVAKDAQRGKKELAHELELLQKAHQALDDGKPLSTLPEINDVPEFRSFSFLSSKPQLVLLNAGDNKSRDQIAQELELLKSQSEGRPNLAFDWLYADAEAEIATLPEEDAKEFLGDLELEEGASDRIIKTSFALLNLIVFLTAGEPEVRAWPLRRGMTAVKAAGVIHSDIERGFIRAEIVAFDDFKAAGSMAAAQKAGKVRLEGKDYVVHDGDIALFRFNV
jgi:ribosome-binding ATPase